MRRRQRRLRQWLRHERLSVAMALAESTHSAALRGQKKARAGGGVRDALHGEVPEALLHHEPGTQHFTLDDDDSVPELGGSRPDQVRPQERVLRHIVEQTKDVAPNLPALNTPLLQMVDQLEDVLQIVDLFVPEQEIEVPKIYSLPRPPPRRVLPVPQTAEQLVDVPLPEWMRLALGSDAFGRVWTCVWMPSTGVYWVLEGTRHTQRTRPTGFTASSGRYINTGQG